MMGSLGAQQRSGESITQLIQRLSQTSTLFTPGSGDAVDHTFGPHLLLLCTRGLFECLALNLYCLRGEQRALTAVINHRIKRMSAEVSSSLINWLTSMLSMRLLFILEHNQVSEDQIQHYIIFTQVKSDIKERMRNDQDYNAQRFPNTH